MTAASIAIVTDSASGLPEALAQQHNIQVIRYWVHLGDESFISGVTIDPPAFFQRLRADPAQAAHTGVPAVAKFLEAYRQAASWAKAIVSVHVAGKQSGTCSAAEVAARESPIPVTIIDTETTAMAEGFVALACARLAEQGATLEQVVEQAHAAVRNVGLYALLENISYALKGGRLSSAASAVGTLLKIQPLIRVRDNKVSLIGQARRRVKGLQSLIDKVCKEVGDAPVRLAVHYAEDEEEGQSVLDALKSRLHCIEAYLTRVPVELGVHAGPGSIGIAYHAEREATGLRERLERLGAQAKEMLQSRLP